MTLVAPKLKIRDFLELGTQPTLIDQGSGEFLVCAVAGTLIMAGYGGDEVVTLVVGQHLITEGPRKGVYTVKAVMIRHNLGDPLNTVKISTDKFYKVEEWVNEHLDGWYRNRPLRDPRALDANPLKHFN